MTDESKTGTQTYNQQYLSTLAVRLAEWYELENDIKAHGLNHVMLMGSAGGSDMEDHEHITRNIECWIERAAVLGLSGTSYFNIHQYLDPAEHADSLELLYKHTRSHNIPTDPQVLEVLESVRLKFRAADKKPEPYQAKFPEDKKLPFRFVCEYGPFDWVVSMYTSITFPTLATAPYMFVTLKLDRESCEAEAAERAAEWLSMPLDQEYYETRMKHLKAPLTWNKTPHKVRGDLLEGSNTVTELVTFENGNRLVMPPLAFDFNASLEDKAWIAPEMK